jgi:hypothetical protein
VFLGVVRVERVGPVRWEGGEVRARLSLSWRRCGVNQIESKVQIDRCLRSRYKYGIWDG